MHLIYGLEQIRWHATLQQLVSNPIAELEQLRNGTLGSAIGVVLAPGQPHTLPGTGNGAAASADISGAVYTSFLCLFF